jgi:general secretion pathway protein E
VTDDGCVVIASGTTLDQTVIDELSLVYERAIRLVAAPEAEIHTAIISTQHEAPTYASVSDMRDSDLQILAPEEDALDDLRALASQAPVIKLVNLTILEALKRRASDVHIESTANGVRIRHRIDGVLHDAATHPRQYQAAVISRIKVMADLNIAERRIPQDGRVRLKLSDRELDLRVSTLPTVHGESVVLRILDRGSGARDLAELGMNEETQTMFERLVSRPHGIVLVTGPTGSGKTTTLYAALQHIDTPEVKTITVEDPVEYQLDSLTQIPVNPKAGRTFATVLRSILRHDPDVIMVGEMRDRETAVIAIQAALTGHLVFSTLHTNDAPGGITRLLDMGVEPYLVAATVQGLLAQRLVRVICTACAAPYDPTSEEQRAAALGGVPATQQNFMRGLGCEVCSDTGYLGRTGVYELMTMSDGLRELVANRAPLDTIRAMARSQGLTPLHDAAWAKARAGITTCAEVLRVTRDDIT